MFKKISLLFSLSVLALSACGTLDVSIAPTSSPQPGPLVLTATRAPDLAMTATQPGAEVLPSPTSSAAASETPTQVVQALTRTPVPPPQSGQHVIRFPANGTWMDINDSLDAGGSKVYALSALQGQVMSVSISPAQSDAYFQIDVKGRDGTVLCDMGDEHVILCQFWRGVLPATQDYYITVRAPAAGGFTLRVAINPPGQAWQYFEFSNPQRSVVLSYSDEFAPTTRKPTGNRYQGIPLLILNFINSEFYDFTNLSEAAFMLNIIEDPQAKSTCMDAEPGSESRTVNGYTYLYNRRTGVAAGTSGEQLIYRTLYQDTCYEIVFHMNSFSIGNLVPDLASKYHEFDRAGLVRKFEEILSTLILH